MRNAIHADFKTRSKQPEMAYANYLIMLRLLLVGVTSNVQFSYRISIGSVVKSNFLQNHHITLSTAVSSGNSNNHITIKLRRYGVIDTHHHRSRIYIYRIFIYNEHRLEETDVNNWTWDNTTTITLQINTE